MAGGRPRRVPRARAASRPSRVPSTMSSRMNSARAAKTWKTSRPPGVVVWAAGDTLAAAAARVSPAAHTTTPGGRLVFHVFAALAEFIRELIVEGTREGLDAARARGTR